MFVIHAVCIWRHPAALQVPAGGGAGGGDGGNFPRVPHLHANPLQPEVDTVVDFTRART